MPEVLKTPTLGGLQFWRDVVWRQDWRVQQRVNSGQHRVTDPQNMCRAIGDYQECLAYVEDHCESISHRHLVILLHGLGRTRRSMAALAHQLSAETEIATALINYPSTRAPIPDHVAQIRKLLQTIDAEKVSFVTHSLGGIIARHVLAEEAAKFGKLAMIAPPNQGSSLARVLSETRMVGTVLRNVMGVPALQLASSNDPAPDPSVPFIVFAGSQRNGLGINPLIDGDDDGVVAVSETLHKDAEEHVVVDSIHSTIMNHPLVRRRVIDFLTA